MRLKIKMEYIYNKYKKRSELIKEYIIEPIIQSKDYVKLEIKSMSVVNENNITYSIVRFLKTKCKHYQLYETHYIKTIVRQKQVNPNGINEPDLEILFFDIKNNIVFEAKRINTTNTPSTYCGSDGFERFISGYYEIKGYCGMLGYMETGRLIDRKNKIKNLLKGKNIRIINDVNNNCFLSSHKKNNGTIKGYHLILDLS